MKTPPRLRLVVDRQVEDAQEPAGLSAWDVRFLQQIAAWPLVLSPDQRATLAWIARRARPAA